MITSNRFKGWGQYTSEQFASLSNGEKYGKLIFVRDLDQSGVTTGARIYFGTRLYAELSDSAATWEVINNIITALGAMVDEKGNFVNFSIQNEILSSATDATEALILLESAIIQKANELGIDIKILGDRITTLESIILYVTGNDIGE